MSPGAQRLERFREANRYLDRREQLQSRFAEDGYLFFRGILHGVERVKAEFVRVLRDQGAVKSDALEPIWTGVPLQQIDDGPLYRALEETGFFELRHNLDLFEQIFGEPVFTFKSPTLRYALPNDTEHVSPPHQDYFFVRMNQSFRTFWIPLTDIKEEVGGLAIAPGIHKFGLVEHRELANVYSYVFRGRKQKGIPFEKIPKPWLTADYHPGDLLVFHNLMVHWALPNRSNQIRLSIDNRCCPMTAVRTWQAEKSTLEARELRTAAQRIAAQEGASEELFEKIMIELMGQGLDPTTAQIKRLIASLTSVETRR
jgi:hypothetical protein